MTANLDRLVGPIADHRATELLVVYELYLTGYQHSHVEPFAVELDGPEVDRLRQAAGQAGLALIRSGERARHLEQLRGDLYATGAESVREEL